MLFSSLLFIFRFLPIVIALILLFKKNSIQNFILLISSIFFYYWGEDEQIIYMLLIIIFNFFMGIWLEKKNKNYILIIGVTLNVLSLIVFKYLGFLLTNFNYLLDYFKIARVSIPYIKLPIGVSFYIFQCISYLMDVKNGNFKASKKIQDFGLYVSFFPQLIAGPIVRYQDVARDLIQRTISREKIESGIIRFVYGLTKKVLIANTAGKIVDEYIEMNPSDMHFSLIWGIIVLYAIQIYFDFSGYSDMAIGMGKIFGFTLPENFNYPYVSKSIREFWRRWHITLSTWFRDYLYIPLGGSKGGESSTLRNLIIVFFITGIWHGASWNFIIWGIIHGFFIVIERLFLQKILDKIPVIFSHLYTIFAILLAWIFFRIENFESALLFIQSAYSFDNDYIFDLLDVVNLELLVFCGFGIAFCMPVYTYVNKFFIDNNLKYMDKAISIILFTICIFYLLIDSYNPFIYFRF